jgi:hypothetical protein
MGYVARALGAVAALTVVASLAGCGQNLGLAQETTCTSPDTFAVAAKLVSDQVEKDALAKSKQADGSYAVSPSAIRAAVALLKISIDDVRTTKADPNSTKKFCTGTMKVVFPLNAIDGADKARSMANLTTVSALADTANVQRNADAFTFSADYDVQPTDDRKSVFVESDSIAPQMDFLAEVVGAYLARPILESAAAAQQQAQQQQAQQQQLLTQQASQAALAQATADNKLSIQVINATWSSIGADNRAQLLDAERAWIAAKAADCNVQAAAASTDPTDRETARLKCDTAANQARSDALKQYMPAPDDQQ